MKPTVISDKMDYLKKCLAYDCATHYLYVVGGGNSARGGIVGNGVKAFLFTKEQAALPDESGNPIFWDIICERSAASSNDVGGECLRSTFKKGLLAWRRLYDTVYHDLPPVAELGGIRLEWTVDEWENVASRFYSKYDRKTINQWIKAAEKEAAKQHRAKTSQTAYNAGFLVEYAVFEKLGMTWKYNGKAANIAPDLLYNGIRIQIKSEGIKTRGKYSGKGCERIGKIR